MEITGLHHITLITSDARKNVAFYTKVLGLKFVKKTVNFDDPGSYHLYYGDEKATTGSAITFFEWPNAPKGAPGIGGTHHFALGVKDEIALLKWKRRLIDMGIRVKGPFDRTYFKSIYFNDPDGVILELATLGPGFTVDETVEELGSKFITPVQDRVKGGRDDEKIKADIWPEPVHEIDADMKLQYGMHHITAMSADIEATDHFFGNILGMQKVKMTKNFDHNIATHYYWGRDNGAPGTLITYFGYKPDGYRRAQMGAGQTHHFALAVKDEHDQQEWRRRILGEGIRVSPVMDRIYFKSIYTNDPDGHIVELATEGPGFAVDETLAEMGKTLRLPPWLEKHRSQIEHHLTPLDEFVG